MTRSAPLFILVALTLACRTGPESSDAQEPNEMDPMTSQPPAHETIQTAADRDTERREMEEANKPAEPAGPAPLAEAERTFVQTAATSGIAEVELSKVALEQAKKPAIKELAQRMVDDHSKANEELKAFASGRGLTVPAEPDAQTKKRVDDLKKLKSTKFDKAYLDHMLEDHRKAVELFRTQSQSGADAELKAWVTRTLPTLEDHLQHVEMVQAGKAHKPKEVASASTSSSKSHH